MKRLMILLAAVLLTSCESVAPVADSGVRKVSVRNEVQVDPNGYTIEQKNVRERILSDNKPGSVKHLYVISPYSGQVLVYSTVRGKVTSGGKRLTPRTIAGSDGGQYVHGYEAPGGMVTHEVLGDDGTYGDSGDYLFWWDVRGIYHQHYLTGGQIVHVSDQPLAVKSVIINMEQAGR
jgi:hypothetical protein